MRKLLGTQALIALLAFTFGYFFNDIVERVSNSSENTGPSLPRDQDRNVAVSPNSAVSSSPRHSEPAREPSSSFPQETVISVADSPTQRQNLEIWDSRLEEFFLINSVDDENRMRIVRGLNDAEHYLELKRQQMLQRYAAENEGTIPKDIEAAFYAERRSLYQQILGVHYEAYEEYERTYAQRRLVSNYTAGLDEPLQPTVTESLIKILHEESTGMESAISVKSQSPGPNSASVPQPWHLEREQHQDRLSAMRSYNQRVLDRALTYLTPPQFEKLESLLSRDVRRYELLVELTDLDESTF